jgi:hypothetical protein
MLYRVINKLKIINNILIILSQNMLNIVQSIFNAGGRPINFKRHHFHYTMEYNQIFILLNFLLLITSAFKISKGIK